MPAELTQGMKLWAKLSDREKYVAELICEGLSNKEIAEKTELAVGSVKNMIHRMYDKIGCDTRVQFVILLFR